MDESCGKINSKLLENLRKTTKFNKEELETLCRIYHKLLNNSQYASKVLAVGASSTTAVVGKTQQQEGIDRFIFREVLHSTFDIVTEELLSERIFSCWDERREGLPLHLDGWLVGLSVFLRGTQIEKAKFCFRIYDLNADGFITKDEMLALLRNAIIKHPQDDDPDESVKDFVDIILRKFDVDKDGKISLEDFWKTVDRNPLLMEAFGQCLPSDSAAASFLATLQI